MSELIALLTACKESPDEDSLRLILADWLEEHGEPDRAEFIRLQVQNTPPPLADLDWEENDPDRVIRAARLDELWWQHGHRWLGPLLQVYPGCRFVRGLVWVEAFAADLERVQPPDDALTLAWLEGLTLRGGIAKQLSAL